MKSLLSRVKDGEVLLADGAIGSLLMDSGLEPGTCPESLNLSRPELLAEIAGLYLEAGADLIQTNSFGGSPAKLAPYGLEAETEAINRTAVEAVRQVVGDRAYVMSSCGPSGKMLEPLGDATPDGLREGFLRQMRVLVAAGVDALCIETMTDLPEAVLAISAARVAREEAGREVPILATLTFDKTPRGFFTIMGVDVAGVVAGLERAGADIIGSNCGIGSETMVEVARAFHRETSKPLIIQPNAGLPELRNLKTIYTESPAYMAEQAEALLEVGVSVIGGCCGTTPAHTRALRALLDRR